MDDDVIEDIEIKDDLYRHGPDFKALNSSLMSEPGQILVLLIHQQCELTNLFQQVSRP